MMNPDSFVTRRNLLRGGLALGAMALFTPGVFAEQLDRTPSLTEGPFYPTHLPLDQNNDLIIVGDSTTPAVGEIAHLSGRILDASGSPLKNATIEIWQCDAKEVYHLTRDEEQKPNQVDKNFQGFGKFETGSTAEYRFRTIKPVPYPGRAPHIHFKVRKGEKELLTTQCYVKGEPRNEQDGVYRGIRDPKARESVTIDFTPLPGSSIGELVAIFDIVLGLTPEG